MGKGTANSQRRLLRAHAPGAGNSHTHTHTRAGTHARTNTRTHAHTHARTHAGWEWLAAHGEITMQLPHQLPQSRPLRTRALRHPGEGPSQLPPASALAHPHARGFRQRARAHARTQCSALLKKVIALTEFAIPHQHAAACSVLSADTCCQCSGRSTCSIAAERTQHMASINAWMNALSWTTCCKKQ